MLTFLRRNLVWMLLAAGLSLSTWTVVTTQQNPDFVDTFEAIPVELRNAPPNLSVRNDVPAVKLVVSAPRDVWTDLRPAKLQAWVDLSRVGTGVQSSTLQELPIEASSIDARVTIQDITPHRAIVHLEPNRVKEVPTRAIVIGEAPAGYLARAPRMSPEVVTITGPQTLVDQVVAAVADVNVTGVTSSISQVYRIQPQNAAGENVDRVAVTPENVLVEMQIEQERAFRAVPVTAQLAGAAAAGYQVIGVRVDPVTVTIEGDLRNVDSVAHISTRPVDLNGASADVLVNAELALPTGVRLSRPQPIVVRVLVQSVQGSKTIDVAPTIQNVGDGLRATVVPGAIRLTLVGPMPLLSSLGPADTRITVDASGLQPGTHVLRPRVQVPSMVRLQEAEPEQVELRLNSIT